MRPDHVPHCVMRVESITVFVPAVIVWRGSSSATVRAGERDVGVDAEIGRVGAHPRDAQRLDDLDRQRPDARLAAVGGDAARREHRTLHAVVHDRERAVDDAAVRVHGHARREVVVLGVAVEPEPVVVVRVAGRGVRDRQRRLVDRIVVERRQHERDRTCPRSSAIRRRRSGGRSRRAPSGASAGSRSNARSVTCTSVAPAATSSGTDRHAARRGRAARRRPRSIRSGACTCSAAGSRPAAATRRDPARAVGDVLEGLAHDRDPRVAPLARCRSRLRACSVPADPQRHAARLQRLRLAVDVAERQRRRVERGRRVAPQHLARGERVVEQLPALRRSRGPARRTPRAASRCRRRGRAGRRDIWSSVAACLASNAAGRSGAMRMPVASRTRVVTAAIAASTISGSNHGASGGTGNLPHT